MDFLSILLEANVGCRQPNFLFILTLFGTYSTNIKPHILYRPSNGFPSVFAMGLE
jgi:hypothetical protein